MDLCLWIIFSEENSLEPSTYCFPALFAILNFKATPIGKAISVDTIAKRNIDWLFAATAATRLRFPLIYVCHNCIKAQPYVNPLTASSRAWMKFIQVLPSKQLIGDAIQEAEKQFRGLCRSNIGCFGLSAAILLPAVECGMWNASLSIFQMFCHSRSS